MMRVFICPECGWIRVVSRRKDVECYKCGVQQMTLAKVDFDTYVTWSENLKLSSIQVEYLSVQESKQMMVKAT